MNTKAQAILADLTFPDTIWREPMLIAIFGFPGAGKTTIAEMLASRYPLVCLTTDQLRLKYGFQNGPDTITAMYEVAQHLLGNRHSVLLDGIHMMRKNRDEARQFGKEQRALVQFVQVVAEDDVIQQRLRQRTTNPEATAQAGKFIITEAHYQRIIQYYEPPAHEADVFTIDTTFAQQVEAQLLDLHKTIQTALE